MTPDDFAAWKAHLRIKTNAEAARRLGIAPNTVTAYAKGRAEIPRHVALACSAIALGVPPWPVGVAAAE